MRLGLLSPRFVFIQGVLYAFFLGVAGCGGSNSGLSANESVRLTPSRYDIVRGESVVLSWQTQNNVESIVDSNFEASGLNGTRIITPLNSTVYYIEVRTTDGKYKITRTSVNVSAVNTSSNPSYSTSGFDRIY